MSALHRAPAACGCTWPRTGHDDGCLWRLDDLHRAQRRAELERRPLPAPRLSTDDQLAMIRRTHLDPDYAARLFAWFLNRGDVAA